MINIQDARLIAESVYGPMVKVSQHYRAFKAFWYWSGNEQQKYFFNGSDNNRFIADIPEKIEYAKILDYDNFGTTTTILTEDLSDRSNVLPGLHVFNALMADIHTWKAGAPEYAAYNFGFTVFLVEFLPSHSLYQTDFQFPLVMGSEKNNRNLFSLG